MIFDDLRWLKRLSLWLLLPVALGLIVLGTALTWLCNTESGARWLFNRLKGDTLQFDTMAGTLNDGLEFPTLSITVNDTHVVIRDLAGRWQLLSLLGGQFVIDKITASTIVINLPPTEADEPPAPWPAFHPPVAIAISHLAVDGIELVQGHNTTALEAVRLAGLFAPFMTRVDFLEVSTPQGGVSASGRLTNRYPYKHQLDITWRWTLNEQQYSGQLESKGTLNKMQINHRLDSPYQVASAGELRSAPSKVVISRLQEITVSLDNQWQDAIRIPGTSSPAIANAELRVEGTVANYQLSGHGKLVPPAGADAPLAALLPGVFSLQASGDLKGVDITDITLISERGQIQALGNVRWQDDIAWQGQLNIQDFVTRGLISLDALLSGAVTTSGTVADGLITSDIDITRISGTTHGRAIEGHGNLTLRWQDQLQLDIASLTLELGTNSLALDGRAGAVNNLNWRLSAGDLSTLGPQIQGKLDTDGNVSGQWPDIALNGKATGTNLRYGDWSAATLAGAFRRADNANGELSLTVTDLSGPGLEKSELALTAVGSVPEHQVSASIRQRATQAQFELTGRYLEQIWRGTVSTLDIDNDYAGRWSLEKPARITAAEDNIAIAQFCLLNSGSSSCGQLTYKQKHLQSSLSLSDLNLAILRQWLPPDTDLAGTLTAKADVEGELASLAGQFTLQTRDGLMSATITRDHVIRQGFELTGRGRIDPGAIHAEGNLDLADTGELAIEADVSLPEADLTASLTGQLTSLAWLESLTTQVEQLDGRLHANVTVAGSVKAPEPRGTIDLQGLTATIPALGTTIDSGSLMLYFDGAQWRADATLKSNQKPLTLTGSGSLLADSESPVQLSVTGEHFPLLDLPDYQASVSPKLDLTYSKRTVTISGKLAIPEADLRVRPSPEGVTNVSGDEVVVPASGGETAPIRIKTAVDLTLGDNVYFKGYGLTTRLTGTVNLKRSSRGVSSARGTISLKDGEYEAYGQTLEVARGLLLFQGSLDDPGLNIVAQRRTTQALVGVEIGGTANNIKSRLFSDPSLPPTDTLSLLATGRLPGNYSEQEGNQIANTAAALGISQSDWLTGQIQRELGVDVLALQGGDTYLDSSLIIGKYLSPKLFVSYVQKLFAPQGSLALEYHLGDRLGLKAESGDAQSLDLLYRIEHE
jgi:translocation and assembly module TamB